MPSPTVENYLKTLYNLSDEGREISLSQVSEALGVSTPTANSMVKKLSDGGYLHYRKYKPLRLTDKGAKAAALIIRKHRLTEMYLVKKMGFGWEEVHEIAEQIEHIRSVAFFERMDEILGHPTIDPHGSPIPDKEGRVTAKNYLRLSDMEAGQKVRLRALAHSSDEFLIFLNSKNLELGTAITILSKEPFDNSLTVSYDGRNNIMLSNEVSSRLLVEATSD